MLTILRLLLVCISRRTLAHIYNSLKSIYLKLIRSFPLSYIIQMSDYNELRSSSPDPPPPFDPSQPSIPISYPIKTLDELGARSYFNSFHYTFNKSSVPLRSNHCLPERRRVLVCHDMQGGYVDDKWIQGGPNDSGYAFWHWYLVDIFVYFSHNLVTLPPPCWINTAHLHGVKVLGTFIAEWDEGRAAFNTLLATKESARMYAECLAELAVALGFDGWLINAEVELDIELIPNLKEFVGHLTMIMHSSMPGSLVIWYDSVTIEGKLDWQNQLNENNKAFFDTCDGIFMNYTWKKDYPKISADVAGDRRFDVYMGIDVFGRGTYGGGQWDTNVALDVLKEDDVSAAIFAPGWVYETNQPPDFQTAQNRWWSLVEKSWGILQTYPKVLPFCSSFDQGHGSHIDYEGVQIGDAPWHNISSQTLQPFLEFTDNDKPSSETMQILVDFKESSYNGGGNITFKGTLDDNAHFTTRLFLGELNVGDSPLHVTYSMKLDGSLLLGLLLYFSTATNEKNSVLLASWGENLSGRFKDVILPHRVKSRTTASGWTIEESRISMTGYTLTEIHAVCYRPSYPNVSTYRSSHPESYLAVLGHVAIKTFEQNSYFPPSSSWLIEGQYVKWSSNPLGSKTVSLEIDWKLEDENKFLLRRYNIFVDKIASGVLEKTRDFLGTAHIEAFYVSDLVVPSGTSCLEFIIQVCSIDGSYQRLNDSPFFRLDIEDDLTSTSNGTKVDCFVL